MFSELETIASIIEAPNRAPTMNDQASTPTANGPHDPNQHIYDFLDYYTDFAEPPKYAVLIDGPWGVGKTHLVNRFLNSKFDGRNQDFVYISLFGLKSTKDIDDALYARAHPFMASKKVRLAGRIVKTFLKHKGIELEGEFKVREFLEAKEFALYVFDDLERSNMSINEVIGYINEFVEHDGCKVLLLANEKEIEQNEVYRTRREKVVGKTLRVHSAFHEAQQQFVTHIESSELRKLLVEQEGEIAHLYNSSKIDNLRVLQQTIWDFERLYEACSEEHRHTTLAMMSLLRFFFPLSFEFKVGHLDAEQLLGRATGLVSTIFGQDDSTEGSRWKEIRDRYAGVNLLDGLLSSEVLESILAKGYIPTEAIRACLDSSPFFASKQTEPSWRTVWHFYERPDDLFETALADMEERFAQREYTLHGEILHVFSLRLWLSSEQLIKTSREEIHQQCVTYVDDLKASGRLPPMSTRFDLRDRYKSYDGLGYHEDKSQDFQGLARYLSKQRDDVFKESLPTQADNLLKLLGNNYEQFASQVGNPKAEEDENFYSTPVLAAIAPDAFVEALGNLLPHQQRRVLLSLSARYAHRNVARDLPNEVNWLRSVKRFLEDSTGQSMLAQNRRRKFAEWFIDPILKEVASEETTATSEADDDESTEERSRRM
jgi:hypothetical protein